jgi:selenocysteine lyase/cysteine desulfurase
MKIDSRLLGKIRRQFPGSGRDPSGRERAFLDNGAGTLVTRRSLEREYRARVDWSANVGNIFSESKGAEQTIADGRAAVADLLNAEGPGNIISGESATSLFFNLSYAIGRQLTGNENVVATGYEHYTNINPWVELGNHRRIKELRFAEFDKATGLLDMEGLKSLIDKNTKVVTVSAASNVLGSRTDLAEVRKMAKEVGAYLAVDAVHHVAHGPTDVQAIGCDFLIFSGYKLFSRHGSFMYMRSGAMSRLHPYKVLPAPGAGPEKWEWGTRDQAMFAAISGAIDYLAWMSNPSAKLPPKPGRARRNRVAKTMSMIEDYEAELMGLVLEGRGDVLGLNHIPGLSLYGPDHIPEGLGRDPTFSFTLRGKKDHEVSKVMWNKYSMAIGAEDYFSRVPAQYRKKTMLRATFVHYNSKGEVLAFLKALNDLSNMRR